MIKRPPIRRLIGCGNQKLVASVVSRAAASDSRPVRQRGEGHEPAIGAPAGRQTRSSAIPFCRLSEAGWVGAWPPPGSRPVLLPSAATRLSQTIYQLSIATPCPTLPVQGRSKNLLRRPETTNIENRRERIEDSIAILYPLSSAFRCLGGETGCPS